MKYLLLLVVAFAGCTSKPAGPLAFVTNEDAGTASITDVKANRVINTMPVGLEPEGAAISPDGRWVYITSETSSSVSVIDTQTGNVVKQFLVGARPVKLRSPPIALGIAL